MAKKLPQLEWTPELSARFWRDLEGSDFLADIAFSKFAAPYLLDLIAPHLGDGDEKVLDYGAGANLYLVEEIARRGFDVRFFEPSASPALTPAHEGISDLSGLRLLTLPPQAFDLVFLSEVIEHLTDGEIAAALGAIKAAMKPTGVLIVTTPQNEDLRLASRYCPLCRQLFHPWGHIRSFTDETLEATLAIYGLQCDELHSVDFSASREPIEQLKALRLDLQDFVREVETLLSSLGTAVPSTSRDSLTDHLARVAPMGLPRGAEDPRRRLIGAGGTLVAIARFM